MAAEELESDGKGRPSACNVVPVGRWIVGGVRARSGESSALSALIAASTATLLMVLWF